MSRNGNGHHKARGNGLVKRGWDLRRDGIQWKKVIEHSPEVFGKQANRFVAQLQDSAQPADALQGLLLDRMAASYLRKQLLLEMEALARLGKRTKAAGGTLSAAEVKRPTSTTVQLPVQALASPDILRYEGLLDQGFHRDLILLMKLKEVAPVPDRADKKLQQPERELIEGGAIV